MGEGKTPEERLEMAKKMGAPEEALEKMKAAMGRENGEKGPECEDGRDAGKQGDWRYDGDGRKNGYAEGGYREGEGLYGKHQRVETWT